MDDNFCGNHTDHKNKITRNEQDIQLIWKEINRMKFWVIAGMSGLLLQVALTIGKLLLKM